MATPKKAKGGKGPSVRRLPDIPLPPEETQRLLRERARNPREFERKYQMKPYTDEELKARAAKDSPRLRDEFDAAKGSGKSHVAGILGNVEKYLKSYRDLKAAISFAEKIGMTQWLHVNFVDHRQTLALCDEEIAAIERLLIDVNAHLAGMA